MDFSLARLVQHSIVACAAWLAMPATSAADVALAGLQPVHGPGRGQRRREGDAMMSETRC
ncbi:MAG: hypothetical protein PHY45_06590 [Rhodocyclaceae bacterium]|nr:hypothetical protein [Rhodocyclaceae bacterium]